MQVSKIVIKDGKMKIEWVEVKTIYRGPFASRCTCCGKDLNNANQCTNENCGG